VARPQGLEGRYRDQQRPSRFQQAGGATERGAGVRQVLDHIQHRDQPILFPRLEGLVEWLDPNPGCPPAVRIDERGLRLHAFNVSELGEAIEEQAGAAIRRAVDLLEPAGTLLVTVPAFQALWTSHDDFNHHVQRFTRTSLARLTEQAGLETVATRYFFFWTCPTKLLIRLKERVLRSPSQMARVPGAFVNRAMYSLSRLEEASLGRLPVPFGSSLLFVGRRL